MTLVRAIAASDDDHALLRVYEGPCGRLRDTNEHIIVNRRLLPDDYEACAAQRSVCREVYWVLFHGKRWRNTCYCTTCKQTLNGSGGNLRSHCMSHGQLREHTQQDMNAALLLFFIKHNIGLTCLQDPLTNVFSPGLSYHRATVLVDGYFEEVKRMISDDVSGNNVFLMIDGWSDQSLRRFVGIAVGYYDTVSGDIIHRALGLYWGEGRDHSAQNQIIGITETLSQYNIGRDTCSWMCSDAAAVNTAIADQLRLDWSPCYVHQLNLIVQHFVDNSPTELSNLLGRINALRKKTRWVEFLSTRSTRRNLAGYSPTRWCSVSECIQSFHSNIELVKQYQQEQGPRATPKFTDRDEALVESVRHILLRFSEANELLMEADRRDGLATVFEVVNAVYLMLIEKAGDETLAVPIQKACREIEDRFFCRNSKSSCRLLFAGILNVHHSIPDWLTRDLEVMAGLLVGEVELFTGATPPGSPVDDTEPRYSDKHGLVQMIDASADVSEDSNVAVAEVMEFLKQRSAFPKTSYTRFWTQFDRLPHLRALALSLRAMPTNTVWLERTFSKARRILTWNRMRLAPSTVNKLWVLSCNFELVQTVLGLERDIGTHEETPDDSMIDDEEVFKDEDEEDNE